MAAITKVLRGQASTEYLVNLAVVLLIATIVVGILMWPNSSTPDVKKSQTDTKFRINTMKCSDIMSSTPCPDLIKGLVAYYKFDEGSGTSATDNKGGNTGTLGAGNSSRVPVWTADAKSGKSLVFDGTDDYVSLAATTPLWNMQTISVWVKTGTSKIQTITGHNTRYWLQITAANAVTYSYWGATSANWVTYATPVSVIAPGAWRHVVLVEDTSLPLPKIYVNGVEATVTGPAREARAGSSSGTLYIGTYGGSISSSYIFNGAIDEVLFYNRALSAEEVRLLYENPGYPQ